MAKPTRKVTIQNLEERSVEVEALFDTGSYYTIVRQERLPPDTPLLYYKKPKSWSMAAQGKKLRVIGRTSLVITIDDKMIDVMTDVSPDLTTDLVIGAGAMQAWEITIRNASGRTEILVTQDMRDPGITSVL